MKCFLFYINTILYFDLLAFGTKGSFSSSFTIPCFNANSPATLGASHSIGSNRMDTGTAVTTMNDCKALILPSPMYNRIAATAPIISDQKFVS